MSHILTASLQAIQRLPGLRLVALKHRIEVQTLRWPKLYVILWFSGLSVILCSSHRCARAVIEELYPSKVDLP